MRKVIGVKVHTVLDGREVVVSFAGPYQWTIWRHGKDITAEFERNDWEAFHLEVDAGAKFVTLNVVR